MKSIAVTEKNDRLILDNPWWTGGVEAVPFRELQPRNYLPSLRKFIVQSEPRRAVVLMGPRRVGKTVLLHHIIERLIKTDGVPAQHILYASLDTPLYTGMDLEIFTHLFPDEPTGQSGQKRYCFFDEIQYLRDWEVQLKSLVDTYPNFKFVASGSAAAALRMRSIESGAGRFTDFLLPPLTFAEFLNFREVEEELIEQTAPGSYASTDIGRLNEQFVDYINYGGYPEVVFSEEIRQNPARFIKSDILDKVLLRDLPSLYGIRDIQELNRLFTTLAYNTGEEISMGGLTQSSGVNKETIRRYLEYLEAAFLIKRVRRIDKTGRPFQRDRQFKVYLTNPSLWAALFGPLTSDHEDMGHLAETALFAQWFHEQTMAHSINYARWDGGDVDFVGQISAAPSIRWATEITWSDRPYTRPDSVTGIIEFFRTNHLERTPMITTLTKTGQRTVRGVLVEYLPTSLYCYTVGKNSTRGDIIS